MKTDIDTFKVAMLYLEDEKDHLAEADVQFLTGSIRSRCLPNLCDPWRGRGPDKRGTHEARVLSQISAFFKKNAEFSDESRCFANTQTNFLRAEKLCRITNKRLDHFGLHEDRMPEAILAQIRCMRTFIQRVLGPIVKLMASLPERIRVTSGASESARRSKSVPFMKMSKRVRCTPRAVPYVRALCRFHTGRDIECIRTNANRVVNVAKDWKTHRSIAAEPIGNLPLQLGVDSFIKERLVKKCGIDLSDQSANRHAAYVGSLSGDLATIDLSMASDTLAFNVIPFLFPYEWFDFLRNLRSPLYKGVFGEGTYSKFSSMGNGFTFSVETLIFAAACAAVGSSAYTVYGDDIIIESHLYSDVVRLLKFLGFVVNPTKSFSIGPFRESCGHDYHHGVNIRPFFIKEGRHDEMDLCHVINGIVSVSVPDGRVWHYMRTITLSNKLLLTASSESTESGVFISTQRARALKTVRIRQWIHESKCYRRRKRNTVFNGIRSLLLWHFMKITHGGALEVSVVPTSLNKVERAWTRLEDGSCAKPHIQMWSSFLLD